MIQEAAIWLHGGCYPKAAQLREGLPRSYGEGWCLGTTWHAVGEAGSCLPWPHHFRFWEMAHEAVWSTGFPWRALLPAAMRIGLCWTCSNGGLCAVPQQAVQGCAACGVSRGHPTCLRGVTVGPSSLFLWTEHSFRAEAWLKSGLIQPLCSSPSLRGSNCLTRAGFTTPLTKILFAGRNTTIIRAWIIKRYVAFFKKRKISDNICEFSIALKR